MLGYKTRRELIIDLVFLLFALVMAALWIYGYMTGRFYTPYDT